MKSKTDIGNALLHIEAGLRPMMSAAATTGDYDSLLILAELAQLVAQYAKRLQLMEPDDEAQPQAERLRQQPVLAASPALEKEQSSPRKTTSTRKIKNSIPKKEYPTFSRIREELLKTGWSKKSGKEYHHKVPGELIPFIASAILGAGTNGRVFQSEDFLDDLQTPDGTEIPGYQAYIVLAWLRKTGLVIQKGREGYSIPHSASFLGSIAAEWETLSQQ